MITIITRSIILSSLMIVNVTLADIVKISDFIPLKKAINKANQDTLVIFDVDHVLIMPTDEYTLNRHPYRKELWNAIENRISKEEWKKLYGITASKAKWRLVDPEIINIFDELKLRKIPTMALSSIYTGKFGVIDSIEDWRIKHLHDLGFDFATLTPIKIDLYAKELEENDGVPILKSGVMLTAQVDKAKMLEHVLHNTNYRPKTIIFVDDMLNNIESLKNLSDKMQIEFYGFHYTAVSEMPLPIINKETEKLRFQILEQEHEWLTHNEMAERNLIQIAPSNNCDIHTASYNTDK
jgi:hypothetical protein